MNTFWAGFYKAAADRKEVSTVGVIKDGKLLMGKRRDNGKWTNPGGHLDAGESPLDGAVRELYEESGIKCDPKDLVHLRTEDVITPTGKKYRIHAYKLEIKEGNTSMKDDPDAEVERWHWLKMPLSSEVMENLHSPKNVLLKGLGLMEKTAVSREFLIRHLKAYDHKRKNYRTFKTERLKEVMASPGFWEGFEKQAISLKWLNKHLTSGEQSVVRRLAHKHESVAKKPYRQRTPDERKWWNRPASEQPIAKARAFKITHWEKLPAAEREVAAKSIKGEAPFRYKDFSKGTRNYWRKYVKMLRAGVKKEGL